MAKPFARGVVLAAVALAVKTALAQTTPPADTDQAANPPPLDVAAPGGLPVLEEVVVSGHRTNVQQATTQVLQVLSSEDIARTGEGDVASALSRVPGLSVVGNGFVYVRGLGDRYSLALLNGSPLPSPEPLKRAVPLDLFPTEIIASSLVQKTYSPNFPGEFGGGVINLTTLAAPRESFLTIKAGVSGDTETTNQLGYDHYGSQYDWTGYNFGLRDVPPALDAFFRSGERISAGNVDEQAIASELVGWRNAAVQKIDGIPPNYSASITGGTSWQFNGSSLGLIFSGGYDNKWRTRDITQQTPASADLSVKATDYRVVDTDDNLVVNGLLGLSYESGPNRLRWTNFYVHDTLKRTSLAQGSNNQNPGRELRQQDTGWYERELFSTQLADVLDLGKVTVDARASLSHSSRKAPFELSIGYSRSNNPGSPFGGYFINGLDNGASGFASVAFSDLSERLVSGGLDATWHIVPGYDLTGGYDYAYTSRDASRRELQILNPGTDEWNNSGVFLLRPDYLLSPAVINHYHLGLVETTEGDPAFAARLRVHGAYAQLAARFTDSLELSVGARFEHGTEEVRPLQVFNTPTPGGVGNQIDKDSVLPAATLTWKLDEAKTQQLRFNASKTIARPQFRELMNLKYYDTESNRTFQGNPLLQDSSLLNFEGRYEWYFAPEQRFTFGLFYKKIDKPIEVQTSVNDNVPVSSFANAPEADLYGAELDVQKYFDLPGMSRRFVVIANYTYTHSEIKVAPGDTTYFYTPARQIWDASQFFRDGAKLTGQSDQLVNLEFGLEQPGRLSQQTILLAYASNRVTSRGQIGSQFPDIQESPGLRVDVVARQGFDVFGQAAELKFEARNLFGHGYKEFQRSGDNVVYFNRYDVGRYFGLSLSLTL